MWQRRLVIKVHHEPFVANSHPPHRPFSWPRVSATMHRTLFTPSMYCRITSGRSMSERVGRAALCLAPPACAFLHTPARTRLEEPPGKPAGPPDKDKQSYFDFTKDLSLDKAAGFWKNILNDKNTPSSDQSTQHSKKKDDSSSGGLRSMADDFMNVIMGRRSERSIQEIVAHARAKSNNQGDIEDTQSLGQILGMLEAYGQQLGYIAEKYLGNIDFSRIAPTALLYYIELEDERKNPSWQRRKHLFYPGIDMDELDDLYRGAELADMCYANTVEDIREGLDRCGYELAFVDLVSAPAKPANFVAVKRDQSRWSSKLEVLMGVRGTKTAADALTDLLCDTADYKGGQAHGFIVQSGQYIVDKHAGFLEELSKEAGKKKIKLSIVGHSLGAGAASIAGIEFNEKPNFEVQVLGFGCPALLSKDLAEEADFITTVINDTDIVPRLSGISVANLLLDIMEFDWSAYAKRDIRLVFEEFKRRQPSFLPKEASDTIMATIEPHLESFCASTIKEYTSQRLEPVLFPPGKCIHFYRDGYSTSAAIVPNDYFSAIHVNRRMIDGTCARRGCSVYLRSAYISSLPFRPFVLFRLPEDNAGRDERVQARPPFSF